MRRGWKRLWKFGAIAAVIALIPTAALAATGTFTSTTTTPAVTGTNSSAAGGSPGVFGTNTGGGLNTRFGVLGTANGPAGAGVWGTGTKYGVFSNGPLGIASGKFLTCLAVTGCVGSTALVNSSVTSTKLAAGSVGSSALAAGSVTSTKLAAGSVDVANLTTAAKQIQPLASGQSESGAYSAADGDATGTGNGFLGVGVTYTRPLSAPLSHGMEDTISGLTTECPGAGSALPGWLCFYPYFEANSLGGYCYTTDTPGAVCYFPTKAGGGSYVGGTYTVTAG